MKTLLINDPFIKKACELLDSGISIVELPSIMALHDFSDWDITRGLDFLTRYYPVVELVRASVPDTSSRSNLSVLESVLEEVRIGTFKVYDTNPYVHENTW